MPAATLPKKLHTRLDELASRVRKVRTLRAVARTAFLLPIAALICILADAYLGLPTAVRVALLVGWVLLALRQAWSVFHAVTAPVDLEAVASAVEQEFPRLAERLTTAVELAGRSDESNGAPALINEVIKDADSRARKLELANAFPSSGAVGGFATATILLLLLLIPAFFAPQGGQYLRRFFLPGYTPEKVYPFNIVVTSGDSAVKRGAPVTLTALLEPKQPDAELPKSATLVVIAGGKEERLAMASDEANVFYLRRPSAESDFDYRVEAGGAVSETFHVTVVEPITLSSARVLVTPPPYVSQGREPDPPIEGLGELVALEHSTIMFDLRFDPKPASALLEFTANDDVETNRPVKQRHQLKIADDGSTKIVVPAKKSGSFALKAEGARGVTSDFPAQPLQVIKDEKPNLPRITGLSEKQREVRPSEKIVVECMATDDVAVAKLLLEWRLDDGPVQTIAFETRGLPSQQVEGRATLTLADRVKVGQKLSCRIAATDNRDFPEAKLSPQTTYYPEKEQWSDFEINARAEPLAEQDITQRKAEIESKLMEIQNELKVEKLATDKLEAESQSRKALNSDEQDHLKRLREQLAETTTKLHNLANDVGLAPELVRLAKAIRELGDRELQDAESALAKARDEATSNARTQQFRKASKLLDSAINKIDNLIKENERIAKERLDRRKLEELSREQQELADKTKKADPKEAEELAKKQKELEEELAKLKEQSEAIKKAADAAKAEEAKKLADEAERLADEMRDLNEAMRKTEKDSAQERFAELKKKQEELARKAKELAEKTDTPTRIAQKQPLKPDDAAAAKESLDKGDLDEAMKQQEMARRELDRLARELEQAAADSRDPREAAMQLARLQEDLRNRLAQETKDKPLDRVPAERRAALEKQQEAIERATSRLKLPAEDTAAEITREQAVDDAKGAGEMLKNGAERGADKKMQETVESLQRLAERLPTKEQRLAKAKDELAKLKKEQEAIQKKAEAASKAADRQDPDAAAVQRELADKLAESAKQQAELAEKLTNIDAPGQESRKNRVADAMQRAAEDLTAGRSQDVAASQQAAKRELNRLEQALNGQTPADEEVAELAKKQRELAEEATKNASFPERAAQDDIQKRQAGIARELEKVQTPEAATTQAEASEAARKAEATNNPDELAKKTKEAADKLDQLNERVNGKEDPSEVADRLAKRQAANAEEQEKKKDANSTADARKKAAQELDELKNLRTGPDAQRAKQQAQDALQKAANAQEPMNNARAQREAADALKDLAEKLSRDQTAKRDEPPADPADAADRLAKKQKELAEKTKQELDKAQQMGGEAGEKARQEALQKAAQAQRELTRQAGELPGQDSPKDRQQAQEAMNKAAQELDKQNADGAAQKQKEAAEALERLARSAERRKQDDATASNPDLPNRSQAREARQLAEEQKRLQEQARQAAEELAKENAPRKDNPVEELAKQQQQIANEAADLAEKVTDRQGAQADQSKQARAAAEAAKQTSDLMKNGDLKQAQESGKQAAQSMERIAQDKAGGESGQKAKELARRQADLNKKLEELAKDGSAGRAQQTARQQQLENQARDLGQKLHEMAKGSGMGEKAQEAAQSAKQSGDKMQAAQQAAKRGQNEDASLSRQQAAEAMERASRQAGEVSKELAGGEKGNGSPQAGDALNKAQDQMGNAKERLGKGQPGEAGNAMEKAAQSLQQAANQLGQGQGQGGNGEPKPGQGKGGANPGGNIGGPGGKLDLKSFDEEVKQHDGKSWGELPGEIKTKIIQQMKARYGEDYARNIKLYFEQLAERK